MNGFLGRRRNRVPQGSRRDCTPNPYSTYDEDTEIPKDCLQKETLHHPAKANRAASARPSSLTRRNNDGPQHTEARALDQTFPSRLSRLTGRPTRRFQTLGTTRTTRTPQPASTPSTSPAENPNTKADARPSVGRDETNSSTATSTGKKPRTTPAKATASTRFRTLPATTTSTTGMSTHSTSRPSATTAKAPEMPGSTPSTLTARSSPAVPAHDVASTPAR